MSTKKISTVDNLQFNNNLKEDLKQKSDDSTKNNENSKKIIPEEYNNDNNIREIDHKLNKLSLDNKAHANQKSSSNSLPYQDFDFLSRDLLLKLEESSPVKSSASLYYKNVDSRKISMENEAFLDVHSTNDSTEAKLLNEKLAENKTNENKVLFSKLNKSYDNNMLQYYNDKNETDKYGYSNRNSNKVPYKGIYNNNNNTYQPYQHQSNYSNQSYYPNQKINHSNFSNQTNYSNYSKFSNYGNENNNYEDMNNINNNNSKIDNHQKNAIENKLKNINLNMYNNTSYNHIFSGKTGWFCVLCKNFNFESNLFLN